jgi:hypothetical protein
VSDEKKSDSKYPNTLYQTATNLMGNCSDKAEKEKDFNPRKSYRKLYSK